MSGSAEFAAFAEHHLDVQTRQGNNWMCRCISHNESRASMSFNIDTGLWICFSCNAHGGMITMRRLLGLPIIDAPKDTFRVELSKILDLLTIRNDLPARRHFMPEDQLAQFAVRHELWTMDREAGKAKYGTEGRAYTDETVELFGLGYSMMSNALTIPARDHQGHLLGVILRHLDDDLQDGNKYKYPLRFPRKSTVFGSWLWPEYPGDTIVLTEGAAGAMSVWQANLAAGGLYGSAISEEQVFLLRRSGAKSIILFGDNDQAGEDFNRRCVGWVKRRNPRSRRMITEYHPELDLRRWFDVRAISWDDRHPHHADPNDLDESVIEKMVARSSSMS